MRIVKKERGSGFYYYLQHSFRKKGKIFTKEKYLGKVIPKDLEELKTDFLNDLNKSRKKELYNLFNKIKKNYQKEWKDLPDSIKNKITKQYAVDFTYNTNAIEGSTITLEETHEIVENKIAPNKPIKDIKEIEKHYESFMEMLNSQDEIKNALILYWHEKLFSETKRDIAGKYRNYLVRVGSYIAPDWQDVKNLMNDMIAFYKENKNMNPVELSARIHYKFEKIHPFGDGNGRVGRILMNCILHRNKYPMLIIEHKKRLSYYKALNKEENQFFEYFSRRYIKAYSRYLKMK